MPTRFSTGNSSYSSDDDGEGPSLKKPRLSLFSSGDELDDDEDGDISENPEDEELHEENDDDAEELGRLDAEEEEQEVVEEENCVEYHTIAEHEDVVFKFRNGKRKDRDTVGPHKDGSISATLTHPDVLDCPVCVEPMTIPVFQCENGHTACSSCCSKLRNKCCSCSLPIGYNRCRAIEKVLQSIIISCRNMVWVQRDSELQ